MAGTRTKNFGDVGTPSLCAIATFGTTNASELFFRRGKSAGEDYDKISTDRSNAALFLGGATIAMAQNGPPTGGYPPARWNPNFYSHYGYHHRYYA